MRNFISIAAISFLLLFSQCSTQNDGVIMTVKGPVKASEMGVSLTHEHILVDFIGADSINQNRWDKLRVSEKVLPYLTAIKDLGCRTFVECTPEYIGRDPVLLKSLSEATGLNIITNTGYYGAANDKYIPKHAYDKSAEELASGWVAEWNNGIGNTGIKPGFIKIGVDSKSLSDIDRKLVVAAAMTHLKTGLVIASHTGPAIPAFEQLEILQSEGVNPKAFIWVHAQGEKDLFNHIKAAKMGAWIGLDGINENNCEDYVRMIKNLKDNDLLNKILLSHDAGWYDPAKENGGEFRGFTTLFEKLIPLLKAEGFTAKEIDQLMVTNPAEAFAVRIRNLKK
ncbi:MAG: phosphotriesterase [Bacteroidales bacterium]|nr:phosphotriesterase [Bacteroidales bacterium]